MSVMDYKGKLLPVKSDFVFKLIFGDQENAEILAGFLKSELDIPAEEYDHLTIVNPYVKRQFEDDKEGILDVKVHTKSGYIVHVESQVLSIPEMRERMIFYQSRLVSEQVSEGDEYKKIKRVVSILITDFVMIPESEAYYRVPLKTVIARSEATKQSSQKQ